MEGRGDECFGLVLLLQGDKNNVKQSRAENELYTYVQSYLHEDTVKGMQAGE